jgi:hypothetical protein
VVLIGHSQGTFNLIELAAEEIDPKKRKARKKLVSALLLGGNVTVADGQDAGGDFRRIRACRSRKQLGCVVAFSTFNGPVPANAVFGRTSEPGREVLCTNPAALGGGSAPLDTIQPSEPFAAGDDRRDDRRARPAHAERLDALDRVPGSLFRAMLVRSGTSRASCAGRRRRSSRSAGRGGGHTSLDRANRVRARCAPYKASYVK